MLFFWDFSTQLSIVYSVMYMYQLKLNLFWSVELQQFKQLYQSEEFERKVMKQQGEEPSTKWSRGNNIYPPTVVIPIKCNYVT